MAAPDSSIVARSRPKSSTSWVPCREVRENAEFDDSRQPTVFSQVAETKTPLSEWLNRGDGGNDLPIVAVELTHRHVGFGGFKIGSSLKQLTGLTSRLNVPQPAIDFALRFDIFGKSPAAFVAPAGELTWHVLPFFWQLTKLCIDINAHHGPVLVFAVPTSTATSGKGPESGPSAVILFYNTMSLPPGEHSMILNKLRQDEIGPDREVNLLKIINAYLYEALENWKLLWAFHYRACVENLDQIGSAFGEILDPVALASLDENMEQVQGCVAGLSRLRDSITHVGGLFEGGPGIGGTWQLARETQLLDTYRKWCGGAIRMLDRLRRHVTMKQKTFFETVHINQTNLVTNNLIALRRIAVNDKEDSIRIEKLSEIVARDGRQMKRLAYLNMAFLPSAFVATFFAMPFLSLDEDMNFKNPSRLWIFFLLAAFLTAVTFGASATWDRHEDRRVERILEAAQQSAESRRMHQATDRNLLDRGNPPVIQDTWKKLDGILKAFDAEQAAKRRSEENLRQFTQADRTSTSETSSITEETTGASSSTDKGKGVASRSAWKAQAP